MKVIRLAKLFPTAGFRGKGGLGHNAGAVREKKTDEKRSSVDDRSGSTAPFRFLKQLKFDSSRVLYKRFAVERLRPAPFAHPAGAEAAMGGARRLARYPGESALVAHG